MFTKEKNMEVIEVIKKVQSQGTRKPDPIEHTEMKPGDIHWQGDVGILMISEVPDGFVAIKNIIQLAPGTSRGSRHIIHEAVRYQTYRSKSNAPRSEMEGPVIVSDSKFRVDHPDHGTVIVPPGVYQIRYQQVVRPDGQVVRVRD